MGKIIQLRDPWAGFMIPYLPDNAEAVQIYEFTTIKLLNSLAIAIPEDGQAKDLLRRLSVAYVKTWHPEIQAPPL